MPKMSDSTTWTVQIIPAATGICGWIDSKGGATALTVSDIFVLVEAYLEHAPISFTPTITEIFGCVEYYLGHIENGNTNTGCEY